VKKHRYNVMNGSNLWHGIHHPDAERREK